MVRKETVTGRWTTDIIPVIQSTMSDDLQMSADC